VHSFLTYNLDVWYVRNLKVFILQYENLAYNLKHDKRLIVDDTKINDVFHDDCFFLRLKIDYKHNN